MLWTVANFSLNAERIAAKRERGKHLFVRSILFVLQPNAALGEMKSPIEGERKQDEGGKRRGKKGNEKRAAAR